MRDACWQVVPTALRGCFQSCGQNCAGVERLIVHRAVYDEFVKQFVDVVRTMRQVTRLPKYTPCMTPEATWCSASKRACVTSHDELHDLSQQLAQRAGASSQCARRGRLRRDVHAGPRAEGAAAGGRRGRQGSHGARPSAAVSSISGQGRRQCRVISDAEPR